MKNEKLMEELNRYKSINQYVSKLLKEQDVPAEPGLPAAPPAAPPPAPGGELPVPPAETVPPEELPPPPGGDEAEIKDPSADDTTEELDITDLVNMTKSIKKDMETKTTESQEALEKMDGVFNKLSELETKLNEMGSIIDKIDQLSNKVEQMKPPTPVEKLEMRSLDSYPFNQKPTEFFAEKQEEMRASGKNEYILTKDDVENYSKDMITKSFNPNDQEYNPVKF